MTVTFEGMTKEDNAKIVNIVRRASDIVREKKLKATFDRMDTVMDISAVHLKTPIDLDRLLEFDDFNLLHDVFGIIRHINRETGELKNCFLPKACR
jgi:hypothetical protein